ncbi:unnamed protein product [Orchesella dallaii]|uniref:Uncharacterized protein n=1 Tax=Orchesella dallaii TaxID=48710 RepID=A0ABP1SAP2_9HEXA
MNTDMFPDDDLDKDLSIIDDDGRVQPEQVVETRKRKQSPVTNGEEDKRPRTELFTSALIQKLKAIDPGTTLQIHNYIEDVKKDVIVREYIDKLLELNFIPRIPSSIQ